MSLDLENLTPEQLKAILKFKEEYKVFVEKFMDDPEKLAYCCFISGVQYGMDMAINKMKEVFHSK